MNKKIFVASISGNSISVQKEDYANLPVDEFLEKPISKGQLLGILKKAKEVLDK